MHIYYILFWFLKIGEVKNPFKYCNTELKGKIQTKFETGESSSKYDNLKINSRKNIKYWFQLIFEN